MDEEKMVRNSTFENTAAADEVVEEKKQAVG